jgi:magnesium chelatase subunit I
MNPEEGPLRPQIQDRFGLRVVMGALREPEARHEVYRRVRIFREGPHQLVAALARDTIAFGEEIVGARERLPRVELAHEAVQLALRMILKLDIASQRAEICMLEAARAYAAADGREVATAADVVAVAPMALRQRRSDFMRKYSQDAQAEEAEIKAVAQRAKEMSE